MAQDDGSAWYVLTSKPRQEAYAEEQLNNQGYVTYRPLAMRERRRRGKLVKVTESLFPRYLFIQLNRIHDNWAPIRSTYGVSGFVQFGDYPLSIPDALIEEIQEREGQFQERAIDLDRFHRGDRVIITSGSFQGLEAVFERYSGEERAVLLMNLLSEQASVAVSTVDLCKIA
ncbi:MAG: transcription/translation regulatory transformer protein RfaH [Proteobacteria bacterium]|nr:MAG: transcription/translation regulatory transformer protein RfaH [Pseudomonadota bacterium]